MGSDPNQEEYIMSEQEKNTTPAQNAAPAAPKPPKIDNAALKKAATALREENNPQNFNAVINLMMRGVFLAPAKIEIGENAPKPDENGRIQLPKDTKVTFALLKSGDGKSFFTAFTDAEELDKWQNKPAGQVMLLRFDDYARMLNGNDHVAGFVLNPFTDNLRFNSDMVASLLKQRNAMLEKIKQTAAQQAAHVIAGLDVVQSLTEHLHRGDDGLLLLVGQANDLDFLVHLDGTEPLYVYICRHVLADNGHIRFFGNMIFEDFVVVHLVYTIAGGNNYIGLMAVF